VVEAVSRKRTPDEQQKFFFVVAQNYKVFLHPDTVLTDYAGGRRPDHARALAHLHATVPEPWKAFFEPLAPGERIYYRGEIEAWRRARDRRRAASAPDRD
jgi:hypothetical protein